MLKKKIFTAKYENKCVYLQRKTIGELKHKENNKNQHFI